MQLQEFVCLPSKSFLICAGWENWALFSIKTETRVFQKIFYDDITQAHAHAACWLKLQQIQLYHVLEDELCLWRPSDEEVTQLSDHGIEVPLISSNAPWMGKRNHSYGHLVFSDLEPGTFSLVKIFNVPGVVPLFEKQKVPLRLMSWCAYRMPDSSKELLQVLSAHCGERPACCHCTIGPPQCRYCSGDSCISMSICATSHRTPRMLPLMRMHEGLLSTWCNSWQNGSSWPWSRPGSLQKCVRLIFSSFMTRISGLNRSGWTYIRQWCWIGKGVTHALSLA